MDTLLYRDRACTMPLRENSAMLAATAAAHLEAGAPVRVVNGMVDIASLLNHDEELPRRPPRRAEEPTPVGALLVAVPQLGESVLVCKQCAQWSADAHSFRKHKARKACTSPNICRWPECPKVFKHSHQLLYHVRVHTREKPYACQLCPAAFAQPGDLSRHTRTHTGEKPCECPVCGRTFAITTTLNRHMNTHGRTTPRVVRSSGSPQPRH